MVVFYGKLVGMMISGSCCTAFFDFLLGSGEDSATKLVQLKLFFNRNIVN